MGTDHGTVLAALADPTRRAILERVGRCPAAVGELARELPITRPAVSQHLKILKEAGLVRDRAVGTRRIYAVDPAGLAAARDYFEQFWRVSLESYAEAANTSFKEEA